MSLVNGVLARISNISLFFFCGSSLFWTPDPTLVAGVSAIANSATYSASSRSSTFSRPGACYGEVNSPLLLWAMLLNVTVSGGDQLVRFYGTKPMPIQMYPSAASISSSISRLRIIDSSPEFILRIIFVAVFAFCHPGPSSTRIFALKQ